MEHLQQINLTIEPTTGNPFQLPVRVSDSINDLKQAIATKFRLTKEQIVLLWRESKLDSGTIASNSIEDGSKIRLVPCIETGLVAHRPDESAVLTALNTLNSEQVAEFLSGKSPLNLTMRLGEHVMLIQLQLSRVGQESASVAQAPSPSSSSVTPISTTTTTTSLSTASRTLTRTLKKLSSTVGKSQPPHLKKQSRGVYSGTFSGTLNPTLQDTEGRPHEHVSTIVHILNDLLGTMEEEGSSGGFKKSGAVAGGKKRKSPSPPVAEGAESPPRKQPTPTTPATTEEPTTSPDEDRQRLTEKLNLLREKLRGRRRGAAGK